METYQTFRDVIDAFESRPAFAAAIGASRAAVDKMYEKDAIRGVYFDAIVQASRARHGDARVTADDLCRIAARAKKAAA